MTRTVRAPGKVVLVGEYAVVDGGPAVVAAVDVGVRCTVAPGGDHVEIVTPDADTRFVAEALSTARPGRYTFATDPIPGPPLEGKPGLGGSAAACVAACIAADRPPTDAYELHLRAQGSGSGVDVAASIVGGITLFERRRCVPLATVEPVVVWTGTSASTAARLELYRAWETAARRKFVGASRAAVYRFLDDPVDALERNGALLVAMAEDAGIPYLTDAHRRVMQLAAAHDGAAKPSGAGGGDCAVALFRSRGGSDRFVEACAGEGLRVLDLAIAPGASFEDQDARHDP